jgi:heme-degrading monooxygenase HmoA
MQNLNGDAQRTRGTGATPPVRPGTTVVVATRFVVRRRRHTLPFLRAALASGREAEAVPGFLGGTVLADLRNRQFWTVSVWASPEAVRSYGSAPAHAEAMRRTGHRAAEAQVERWRTHAFQVPSLVETAQRLGVPGPRRGLVRHLRPHELAPAASDSVARGPDHRSTITAGSPPPLEHHHGSTNGTEGS